MVVVGVVKESSILERLDTHQLKVETAILIAHLTADESYGRTKLSGDCGIASKRRSVARRTS